MPRSLRFVLMCLLALALPWQGYAAATMRLGAPVHHASVPDLHAHHGLHTSMSHALPAADGQAVHPVHPKAGPAGADKCSLCATCCLTSALAPPPPVLPLVPMVPTYAATASRLDVGVLPDVFERPPRPFLA